MSIVTGNISADKIKTGSNTGDGSIGNVVTTGDNNTIIVKIIEKTDATQTVTPTTTPTPTQQSVIPNNNCYGNCAYNGSTINVNPTPSTTVSKTTATNGFWLFVQMAISPFVILNDYIIQNK